MIAANLLAAYRFHRARNMRISGRFGLSDLATDARTALELARADVAAGVERYTPSGPWRRPADCPTVFFESQDEAARAGFRFVDYADEINRSVGHRGWFTDREFQDDTFRGAVFQLATGPRGLARFANGYQESISDGFVIWVDGRSAVHQETVSDRWTFEHRDQIGAARDAAYSADGRAQHAAEEECDYREAWRAGQEWSDLAVEIEDARREIRTVLAERRALMTAGADGAETLCAMVKREVSRLLRTIRKARERRETLAQDYDHLPGWADGAA